MSRAPTGERDGRMGQAIRHSELQLSPMLAAPGRLPIGPDWSFEVKWDGIRALVAVSEIAVEIRVRDGHSVIKQFPEFAQLNDAIASEALPLLIDGEIVMIGESGVPDLNAIHHRVHPTATHSIPDLSWQRSVHLAGFDLLVHGGRPVIDRPYLERRALLENAGISHNHVSIPDTFDDGAELFRKIVDRGLEGVVAKRRDAPYLPGRRSRNWIKVKAGRRTPCVVGD